MQEREINLTALGNGSNIVIVVFSRALSTAYYINDSYRTICIVCFPPNVVAASAIYLASRIIDYPLPNLEWWKIFGANFDDM